MSKISSKIKLLEDFKSCSDSAIKIEKILGEILGSFEEFPFGSITLHAGAELMRVRPNKTPLESFTTRKSLSFKPQDVNFTYQRASTPDQTMFYGSLIDVDITGIPNILTPSLEGILWIRDNNSKGKQKVTYSRWRLRSDVNLIPIILHEQYSKNIAVSQYIAELKNYINANHKDSVEVIEFLEFISKQFATPFEDDNQANYYISSIFTKIFLSENHYDGIVYPSSRVDGETTNFALLPDAVDKNLDLIFAGECMLYKNEKEIYVNKLTESVNPNNEPLNTFHYKEVDLKFWCPEIEIYGLMGVKNLEYIS